MKKKLLQCGGFFLVFCLVFQLLTPVFLPKDNAPEAGIHDYTAKGFLAEPENSIDVFFVGDSEVFSTFIPLRIWEQYGITSYSCSVGDQTIYQSLGYLNRALENQNPKIIVLETYSLFREFTLADMISHWAQDQFPFLRYHDRWKKLSVTDWTEPVDFRYLERDKGYVYRSRAIPADGQGHMEPSEDVYSVPLLIRWYFRQIYNICQKRGIQLMLVSTPSTTNWDTYHHNGIVELLEGLDADYMDMNLLTQEIPIDWSTDTYDAGDHLNYYGACKVTDYMGAWLEHTGLFTDKRNEVAYASWNAALAEFQEMLAQEKALAE